jgi:hypothetical protein
VPHRERPGDSAPQAPPPFLSLPPSHRRAQLASGKYLARANRGLLKLYSLFPARSNLDNIVLVLTKVRRVLPPPCRVSATLGPRASRAG